MFTTPISSWSSQCSHYQMIERYQPFTFSACDEWIWFRPTRPLINMKFASCFRITRFSCWKYCPVQIRELLKKFIFQFFVSIFFFFQIIQLKKNKKLSSFFFFFNIFNIKVTKNYMLFYKYYANMLLKINNFQTEGRCIYSHEIHPDVRGCIFSLHQKPIGLMQGQNQDFWLEDVEV